MPYYHVRDLSFEDSAENGFYYTRRDPDDHENYFPEGPKLTDKKGQKLMDVQNLVIKGFEAEEIEDETDLKEYIKGLKPTQYMIKHAKGLLAALQENEDVFSRYNSDISEEEDEDDEEWTPKTPPRTRSATKAAEAAAKASGGGSAASSSTKKKKKKKKKKAEEKKAKKVSKDKYIAIPGGINVDEKGNVTPVKRLQCMGTKKDGDRCSRMPSLAKGQWLERLEGNYWVCSQHNNSKTVVSSECKIESGGAAAAKAIEQEIDSDDDEEFTKAIPVLSRSVKEIVKQIREDFKLVDQLKAKVQNTREALDNFDETESEVAQLDALLTKLERLDLK